jgi:hypothetical protein
MNQSSAVMRKFCAEIPPSAVVVVRFIYTTAPPHYAFRIGASAGFFAAPEPLTPE